MCLGIGTLKTINFLFFPNGKLMVTSIPVFKHIKGSDINPLSLHSVRQIRRGNRKNLGITLHITPLKYCDTSLEPSCQDGSNEGSQHMFSLRKKEKLSELSSIPPLTWSSAALICS